MVWLILKKQENGTPLSQNYPLDSTSSIDNGHLGETSRWNFHPLLGPASDREARSTKVSGITVYWPPGPSIAISSSRKMQSPLVVGEFILAPPIPPLVQPRIHRPQNELSTEDIPILFGRTLERFAFTDTSMPLECLVPWLIKSKQVHWCVLYRRFFNARHVRWKSAITTLIIHGYQRLGMDDFDRSQGCAITLRVGASILP